MSRYWLTACGRNIPTTYPAPRSTAPKCPGCKITERIETRRRYES